MYKNLAILEPLQDLHAFWSRRGHKRSGRENGIVTVRMKDGVGVLEFVCVKVLTNFRSFRTSRQTGCFDLMATQFAYNLSDEVLHFLGGGDTVKDEGSD